MKEKRFSVKNLNIKFASRFLGTMYLISILPMLYISIYNYPSADDFAMGVEAYRGFRDMGNIFAAFGQGIYMAWYDYVHWMGYFTSTFFMSVPPSVFGEKCYIAGVYIILGTYTFGMIYFMHALLVKALRVDKYLSNCITMITLILTVQCMPQGLARIEAFFWYCSAANYVLMYSQGLIFLGLVISTVFDTGRKKRFYDLLMATVIGFFIGGANYMTSLSVAMLCVFLLLVIISSGFNKIKIFNNLWRNDNLIKKGKILAVPSISMLIGFMCSCMAPGNNIRATGLTGMSPVKSILTSLYYTLRYPVSEWTTWAVVCFLLLLVPFFWKAVQKTKLAYRYPILATIFAYGMISANIVPPMYAEGNISAGRLQALFWMQYVLCIVLLEGYLLGWLYRHMNREKVCSSESGLSINAFSFSSSKMIIFICVILIWGSALSVHVNPDYYTSSSALQDIMNGSAKEYGKENDARRALLHDKAVKNVVFQAYTRKPDLLFFADITTDPADWTNEAVRRYYDKNSVVLENNK